MKQHNQAMHNKIFQLERQNRFQSRGNPNWDKSKQVQQSKKIPNPLGGNNVAKQDDLNWCNPCSQAHNHDSFMYAKEIAQMENEFNNEDT